MRASILLCVVYALMSVFLLLGPAGGAGHGDGGQVFFFMSLPLGAVSLLAERLFKSGEIAVLTCFAAGVVQYGLIGFVIDRVVGAKRKN